MKRYNITAENKPVYSHEHGQESLSSSGDARIAIEEQFNGEWVRYEDVGQFRLLLNRVVSLYRNPKLGDADHERMLIEKIEEALAGHP